ncbi:hypothetical protein Tco_0853131 [Tanacetum coccineum]
MSSSNAAPGSKIVGPPADKDSYITDQRVGILFHSIELINIAEAQHSRAVFRKATRRKVDTTLFSQWVLQLHYLKEGLVFDVVKEKELMENGFMGDSLNLPDHRIHKDEDGDALFPLNSDSLPHAHA